MRRLLTIFAVLTLMVAGCGGDDEEEEGAGPTATTQEEAAGPQEYTVVLDGKTDAFNGEFAHFFPGTFSVHPGDTVTFSMPAFSGVPHTVTLGTLVDEAVAKLAQLGPQSLPVQQEETPEMLKLPDVFPHGEPQGPPTPNQSAAQACYLTSGTPPVSLPGGAPACPKASQPDFDGTHTFFNSGMLAKEGDSFEMAIAPDAEPGTYSMICLIHRGVMTGEMTVAPEDATIPTPEEVTTEGEKEFNDVVQKLTPVAQAMQQATPDKAALGGGDPTKDPSVVIADFGPKQISIPVGGSVTWSTFAFHSLAFNASEADVGVVTKQSDGSWQFLQKAAAPAGFNMPPEAFVFPPPATSKPLLIDLGAYDGAGFRNTGVVGSLPPQFISFKVTFTKPGTFTMLCLLHTDMEGEIKVG